MSRLLYIKFIITGDPPSPTTTAGVRLPSPELCQPLLDFGHFPGTSVTFRVPCCQSPLHTGDTAKDSVTLVGARMTTTEIRVPIADNPVTARTLTTSALFFFPFFSFSFLLSSFSFLNKYVGP